MCSPLAIHALLQFFHPRLELLGSTPVLNTICGILEAVRDRKIDELFPPLALAVEIFFARNKRQIDVRQRSEHTHKQLRSEVSDKAQAGAISMH
jgi:hypothetical protein